MKVNVSVQLNTDAKYTGFKNYPSGAEMVTGSNVKGEMPTPRESLHEALTAMQSRAQSTEAMLWLNRMVIDVDVADRYQNRLTFTIPDNHVHYDGWSDPTKELIEVLKHTLMAFEVKAFAWYIKNVEEVTI